MFEDSRRASDVNIFGEDILQLPESQDLETRGLNDVPSHSALSMFIWAGLESILQLFYSDTMFEDSKKASDVTSPRYENNCIEQLSLSKILCF